MKPFLWVAVALVGFGAVLCGYGVFALEPGIFEMGIVFVCLAVVVTFLGLSGRWFLRYQRQTVACVQCGVSQRRSALRFMRCAPCREKNRQAALAMAASERERRQELARTAEKIIEQQKREKLTSRPQYSPQVATVQRGDDKEIVPRTHNGVPMEGVPAAPMGNIATCPRCHSPSIQFLQRGYSAGAGTLGCCLIGPAGMLLGAFGSSQADRHCLNCRYKW